MAVFAPQFCRWCGSHKDAEHKVACPRPSEFFPLKPKDEFFKALVDGRVHLEWTYEPQRATAGVGSPCVHSKAQSCRVVVTPEEETTPA